jgi:hypothetical protein
MDGTISRRPTTEVTAIMARQQATPPTVDAPTTRAVAPSPRLATTPPSRVATTSNNIMTPNAIRQMTLVHQCQTCNNNPFHILFNDDNDYDTVVASNCNPSAPPTILPSSVLPVTPPMHQAPRQVASSPSILILLSNRGSYPPPRNRGCQPPRHSSRPLQPLQPTAPSMTYAQTHPKSHSSHHLSPSSKPTPFLLLNLMTIGIVHQPQDHPACLDASPNSSATGPSAISCTRQYIISLTFDLLMPLLSQSLANLPTINIHAL